MNSRIILGLDPGLAIVGFGAIRVNGNYPQKTELIDFGVIQTPAKTDIGQRLVTIYNDLHSLLEEIRPDLVAVEKFFFYRMANTISIAQARGVIMLALAQQQINYVEYTPAQIKQTIAGFGNAEKRDVQSAVAQELALDHIPKPDDAADALAVALTASLLVDS